MKFESFLKWWLIFTLIVLAFVFSAYLGFLKLLWEKDASYLSIATIALFFLFSIKCGKDIFNLEAIKNIDKNSHDYFSRKEESIWFASEACLNIGMLGTIIGFIMMLAGFEKLDISNQQTIQTLLSELGKSMATALYTTLVGLLCGQLLKAQAFIMSMKLNQLEPQAKKWNQDEK
jgi:uncharacterized membrane protein